MPQWRPRDSKTGMAHGSVGISADDVTITQTINAVVTSRKSETGSRHHSWIARRRLLGPPQHRQDLTLNQRVASKITMSVGTMWAVYIALIIQGGWMTFAMTKFGIWASDPYPFSFLLFLSNLIQLLLMFIIMVGQQVLAQAGDRRALQTFNDAEAILHEVLLIHQRLDALDVTQESVVVQNIMRHTTTEGSNE